MTADLIRRIEAYQRGESQEITRILIDCIAALQAPAEGDAGLTDEQANALAAFYDVSPGTVHDIYALSKPKAASDTQPKGTPAGMVLVEGAAFHDGSVSLMRHDAVESFCARRGAERLYRLTAAQSPAPGAEPACTRSHPHDDMRPACEALTEKARAANLVRRFELVADEFGGMFREYHGKAMPDDVYERFCRLRDERIPTLRAELVEAITKTKPAPAVGADHVADASKLVPFAEAEVERLYRNSYESTVSFAAFRRIVRLAEGAHRIGEAQPPVQPMGDANG